MILKNLMEDKQLDLNRPFRSVRRIRRLPIAPPPSSESNDSTKIETSLPKLPTLPAYKSELKSGPIRNPGTVPFLWEQSPGRPKDESRSQTRPPIAPKLPPGRILNAKQQSSDKGSEVTAVTRSHNAPSCNENVMKCDSSKKESEDKESFGSEDDSEAYADANDTLSRTESSLLNCSVSGLSGLDGPSGKPFGPFSDPQARDFMMGRFLPAAKAMASESPHYNTRKQPVASEPLHQHRPTNAQHCEESEDDSDKEHEYLSVKVCGLLPQFCPVPGLRLQGHVPGSPVHRSQAKPIEKPIKSHKNLREMLACKSTEWEVESASSMVEKTLYIDSVHIAKPRDSNSSCSDTKETVKNEEETTCSGDFRQDQELVKDHKTLTSSKMVEDVRTDARKSDSSWGNSCLPLPPPLPKSPSESWLSRALAASSARNQQYNKAHASKIPPFDPKWETIVKTSNAHHERLRFSEELLAPIPEA